MEMDPKNYVMSDLCEERSSNIIEGQKRNCELLKEIKEMLEPKLGMLITMHNWMEGHTRFHLELELRAKERRESYWKIPAFFLSLWAIAQIILTLVKVKFGI